MRQGINDTTIIKWVYNVEPDDMISVEYPERMCTEKKSYLWSRMNGREFLAQ